MRERGHRVGVGKSDGGPVDEKREGVTHNLEIAAARPIVLTIAGFDPSGGAGVSADLKVFAAHELYGMACITALTVQSTAGVGAVEPVAADTVKATLQMLTSDVSFSGIKMGMLGNGEITAVVNNFLGSLKAVPVVLDPVFRSSSGRELLDPSGIRMVREQLLGRVDWITPNLEELSVLTGQRAVRREDVAEAAEMLRNVARKLGNERLNVVVTGGDQDLPNDYLLTADGERHWIYGERVETEATHGTGCAYSSALLCRLVAGDGPLLAATRAKRYVAAALLAAYPVGRGKGPMNHLFMLNGAAF